MRFFGCDLDKCCRVVCHLHDGQLCGHAKVEVSDGPPDVLIHDSRRNANLYIKGNSGIYAIYRYTTGSAAGTLKWNVSSGGMYGSGWLQSSPILDANAIFYAVSGYLCSSIRVRTENVPAYCGSALRVVGCILPCREQRPKPPRTMIGGGFKP